MRENSYQGRLIKRIQQRWPECVVLKNDPSYLQGVPDIILLFPRVWAMLEVKQATSAKSQPNQAYYVKLFGEMAFASFIDPATEEDVLNALQRSLGLSR